MVQESESRRPAILVDQTAEHVLSFDCSGCLHGLRCSVTGGYCQVQPSMWSLLHVVNEVSPEHPLEMPTTVDQDMVEALSAHGCNRGQDARARSTRPPVPGRVPAGGPWRHAGHRPGASDHG